MSAIQISTNHWTMPSYREKVLIKTWRDFLLNHDDFVMCNGEGYFLKAKNLGCGVVEIYKEKVE